MQSTMPSNQVHFNQLQRTSNGGQLASLYGLLPWHIWLWLGLVMMVAIMMVEVVMMYKSLTCTYGGGGGGCLPQHSAYRRQPLFYKKAIFGWKVFWFFSWLGMAWRSSFRLKKASTTLSNSSLPFSTTFHDAPVPWNSVEFMNLKLGSPSFQVHSMFLPDPNIHFLDPTVQAKIVMLETFQMFFRSAPPSAFADFSKCSVSLWWTPALTLLASRLPPSLCHLVPLYMHLCHTLSVCLCHITT